MSKIKLTIFSVFFAKNGWCKMDFLKIKITPLTSKPKNVQKRAQKSIKSLSLKSVLDIYFCPFRFFFTYFFLCFVCFYYFQKK